MIPCIVLAAGMSARMGRPKLRLNIAGKSILRWTLDAALSSCTWPVVVVLGNNLDTSNLISGLPVRMVTNEAPERGQSSSLQAGIDALPTDAPAFVMLLGDQPLTTPDTINRLIEASRETSAEAIACDYREWKGPPALFARSLFPSLMNLTGDRGARSILQENPGTIYITVADPLTGTDVDTWDGYKRVLKLADKYPKFKDGSNES
jgi:molybdenum cofactor cytidylyltransferase